MIGLKMARNKYLILPILLLCVVILMILFQPVKLYSKSGTQWSSNTIDYLFVSSNISNILYSNFNLNNGKFTIVVNKACTISDSLEFPSLMVNSKNYHKRSEIQNALIEFNSADVIQFSSSALTISIRRKFIFLYEYHISYSKLLLNDDCTMNKIKVLSSK